jgi:peptidylprolyl isomerase domain and WD repeat-containing protein 1
VKHYRTHLTPIVALAVSDDGRSLASLGTDSVGTVLVNGVAEIVKGSAKIFDVANFGKFVFIVQT